MIADRRPMVADLSLFEVANAPTNWYVYSIPLFGLFFQRFRILALQNLSPFYFDAFVILAL